LQLIKELSQERMRRSEARTNLATEYLKEGNNTDAIRTLEEAIKLNRRNAKAHEKLGLAYASKEAYELAEEQFLQSLKIEFFPETANNYGLLLTSLGRYDEAILQFDTAIADLSYRNTAIALNNKGYAQYLSTHYTGAIDSLERSIKRAPNLCQARYNIGLAHEKLESNTEALEHFQIAIDLCGEEAIGAYYQSALIQLKIDQPTSACADLQFVVEKAAGTSLATQAAKKLPLACQ
jgi:type IV pilus assembly protein PilF